jgi:hypothetical protein
LAYGPKLQRQIFGGKGRLTKKGKINMTEKACTLINRAALVRNAQVLRKEGKMENRRESLVEKLFRLLDEDELTFRSSEVLLTEEQEMLNDPFYLLG